MGKFPDNINLGDGGISPSLLCKCGHTWKDHNPKYKSFSWIKGKPHYFYMKSGYSSGGNSTARLSEVLSQTYCDNKDCICYCSRFEQANG